MENPIKVVVFNVDVPEEGQIKNERLYSANFNIKNKSGAESTWKLCCNFNGKRIFERSKSYYKCSIIN